MLYQLSMGIILIVYNDKYSSRHGSLTRLGFTTNIPANMVHGMEFSLDFLARSNTPANMVHGMDVSLDFLARSNTPANMVHGMDVSLDFLARSNTPANMVHGMHVSLELGRIFQQIWFTAWRSHSTS